MIRKFGNKNQESGNLKRKENFEIKHAFQFKSFFNLFIQVTSASLLANLLQ